MKYLFKSAIILLLVGHWGTALSQSVSTPKNISMGGGGTTYITGFEANFINPANLMIRERASNRSIGIGTVSGFYNPVMPGKSSLEQAKMYRDFWDAYRPGSLPLNSATRDQLLDRNYKNDRRISEHQHRSDAILAGLKLQKGDQTFSLTARIRNATRIEVGRGWYDEQYIQADSDNGMNIREMSLVQQSQFLYEFSFGYAQPFDFVNGLIPRLGKLYIGIAPKFIIGGSYMNLQYDAQYWFTNEMDQPRFTRSMSYASAGSYSEATSYFKNNNDAAGAIQNFFPSSYLQNYGAYTEPSGYGGGFDFGLTYVLSLGDDLSLAGQKGDGILEKSLRIGFSVTDLGFISYNQHPLSLTQSNDTLLTDIISEANTQFEGRPGQYLTFLSASGDPVNPLYNEGETSELTENREIFTTILPTTFNAGMLLQVDKLLLSADLTIGLNDTAFNNTKLMAHFGMEFRPLSTIPIRLGTQIAAGYPTLWTAGTGIETRRWDFSIGAQFLTKNKSVTPEFSGGAVGMFTYHF
ncbi:MAG: DUF5723 family protein [Balneolaceae bacterium]|nr:DUF5723 family protein [Balneolaceae bacterium]